MPADICPRCGTLRDPGDGHCLKCGFDFSTSELVRAALGHDPRADGPTRKGTRTGK